MKAIIFLAGTGSRLRSVTDYPKCLIRLSGESLIIRYLDILTDVGIKEVVFVVGYKKEKIKKAIGSSYKDIKIKYIENNDYQKGSILTLLYSKDEFNDDIITMDGDVLFDKKILQNLINSGNKNCFLIDFDLDIPYGMKVIIDKQGIVKNVDYNLKKPKGKFIGESVGFIKWSKEDAPVFRKAFEELLKQGIDDDVYEKAIRYLINNDLCQFGVTSVENHPWMYINYPEDLKKAEQFLKNGN